MKNFITNNWRKILVAVGGIFIIINIFAKLVAPKTLLTDYIKYGKDIEKVDIISGDVGEVIDAPESPVTPEILKILVIMGGLILLVVFLTSLADKASADAKAKKK